MINQKRCRDCGISVGRCPPHAQLLAKILKPDNNITIHNWESMGVFYEDNYDLVKKQIQLCPEHALIIKKIKETG
jgi:hypothetical protein